MNTFILKETVENSLYYVEVYESNLYTINIIKNKEFNYTNVEVKKRMLVNYVPTIYVSLEDEGNFNIEIQTTSYGALSVMEYKYFMDLQTSVLQFISDLDILLTEKLK